MSNIKAKRANYCEGGNFMYTANYVNLYFSTLEKELNFKYDYDNYKYKWDQGIAVQPIISSQNYIKPFQTFESQDPQYEIPQQTPVICVHCSINPAKKQDIWRIKSYLSRGIALSSALTVNESQDMFNTYDGVSVLHKRCDEFKNDHQVTLVGYGYKNGQEVWMLKNSWGEEWGANGYFFVPIGKDSFCIEHIFTTILPIGLSLDQSIYENIGSQRRGAQYELDSDNHQLIKFKNNTWIIPVSIVCVIVIVAICIGTVIYLRKQKKQKQYEAFTMRTNQVIS
ncbi:Cathepsin_L [Hexamita inflata]|uniref:Cathepsin_L n=1 Tax=Hexamita inflata TaxID=28002 RepID=A0ABP1I768_9EUKA